MGLTTLTFPSPSATTPPIYTLTLTSAPDHRLTPELIASFLQHLDDIERDWLKRRVEAKKAAKEAGTKNFLGLGGAVVIRGEGEKFFSNGESSKGGRGGREGRARDLVSRTSRGSDQELVNV